MSRLRPFEFAFAELAASRFPEIREEAGTDSLDLAAMARLPAIHRLLQDVTSPDPADPNPRAAAEYMTSLFVAFRYWHAGQHTFNVEKAALVRAIAHPIADEPPASPEACYIQLPAQWFWATIGENHPYEPLEGVFVVRNDSDPQLTVVAVLGLRRDRDGFSQITVSATVSDMLAAAATRREPPFGPVMDGGREAGFLSVTSEGELLHLTHLALLSATE